MCILTQKHEYFTQVMEFVSILINILVAGGWLIDSTLLTTDWFRKVKIRGHACDIYIDQIFSLNFFLK